MGEVWYICAIAAKIQATVKQGGVNFNYLPQRGVSEKFSKSGWKFGAGAGLIFSRFIIFTFRNYKVIISCRTQPISAAGTSSRRLVRITAGDDFVICRNARVDKCLCCQADAWCVLQLMMTLLNYFMLCKILLCIWRRIIFFCHHSFMKKSHFKLSKNEPENIPQIKINWYVCKGI